ncbi:MAG TPA: O-antigen ligase family protein [Candidatus Sulfotelmatobacter sp.]|nr:O-antigen ligase family protein [Candidatus Sulfotelmatobacter sp.]
MSPEIATFVFAIGILGLFWLDRDPETRTSAGLWIPVVWLLIAGSRPVSTWLHMTPPVNQPDAYLDGSPIDRIVLAVLLTLGLFVLLKRGQEVTMLLRANFPILLFFSYCGMSALWSDYPDVATKRWIKFAGNLVMVLIVLTDTRPTVAVKRLLSHTGFVVLPLSVLLVKYYPDLGRMYSPGDSVMSPWKLMFIGVSDTKNGLGSICLMFGLGAVWRFTELLREKDDPHRRRRLIAQAALLLVTLWLFSKADSMTSLSCFLVASALIVATNLRLARRRVMVHLLVAGSLSLSVLVIFVAPSLLATFGRDPTLTGRTDIWKVVLDMAGSPLFGTGFESFWLGPRLQRIWTMYWWHPNEAHNGYLELFLNLGWVGIALFATIVVTGYRNVITALMTDPDFGRIRLAYFVVGIMFNFTESGFRMIDPVWLLFLLTAIVIPGDEVSHVSDYAISKNEHWLEADNSFDDGSPTEAV